MNLTPEVANDGEAIRDHMLKAIFGSFYNEKQKPGNENLKLEWMSHLLGKRELRISSWPVVALVARILD